MRATRQGTWSFGAGQYRPMPVPVCRKMHARMLPTPHSCMQSVAATAAETAAVEEGQAGQQRHPYGAQLCTLCPHSCAPPAAAPLLARLGATEAKPRPLGRAAVSFFRRTCWRGAAGVWCEGRGRVMEASQGAGEGGAAGGWVPPGWGGVEQGVGRQPAHATKARNHTLLHIHTTFATTASPHAAPPSVVIPPNP